METTTTTNSTASEASPVTMTVTVTRTRSSSRVAAAAGRSTAASACSNTAAAAAAAATTAASNAARRSLRIPSAVAKVAQQQQLDAGKKATTTTTMGTKKGAAASKPMAHKKKSSSSKSAIKKGRRQVRPQDRRKAKPLFLVDENGDKVWIATATLQDLRDRSRSSKKQKKANQRLELVTVPSKAVRESIYERAAVCWGRHEARMLPKYGGRPWKVTIKISDPKPPSNGNGGGGKAAAAVTPYFAWNDHGSDLRIAAWPHLLDKIPVPPRFPGYSTARKVSSSNKKKKGKAKKPPSPPADPADSSGKDANEKEVAEESDEETVEAEEEEEEDEDDSDDNDLLEAEITSISSLAYEERWRVPLPAVSIKWVSPLNKTFTTRTSAWENAVMLCKQEVTIDKVLHGYSANGAPLKPTKPSSKASLTTGRYRFERDGLWVVGQEESWQLPRLHQQPEGQSLEPSSNATATRHMSPLAYYLHCNKKEHQAKRQAELKGQHDAAAAAPAFAATDAAADTAHVSEARTETGEKNPVVKRFTLRDAERELRGMWQQLSDAERNDWCAKSKAHHSAEVEPSSKTMLLEPAILEGTMDEGVIASQATNLGHASTSNDTTAEVAAKAHTFIRVDKAPSTPTKTAESTQRATAVTPDFQSAAPKSSIADIETRVSVVAPPPAAFHESTRWKMTPEQCQLCHVAGMDHFDRIMRTVQARDLMRELQDGFDLLRERGRGRFDMELPDFDTPEFSFLSDLKKAPWMPIVREILGKDVVLIHKGMFLALPGAERQVYHQDGVHLTTQYQRDVHAINVFVPVVDMTAELGPTEFCLGSHLLGNEDFNEKFLESPIVKAGTPIIFDYRLGHRGLANASDGCRPIVYCTYARASDGKEFRDTVNFSRKRYHKIGDLVGKVATREERARKRKQKCVKGSGEDLPMEKRHRLVDSNI